MIESKSVTKRSVGRPKKNKALQQLRVQTWFNAVAEASGKTAYELEKEFAPSTVDRENFNKQRARLWEKYRLGKTMPSVKEKKGGKKGTAQLVEEKYPGTLRVLDDPIWHLADLNSQITMNGLKTIYMSLDERVRRLLIDEHSINKRFWRKPCLDLETLLATLASAYPINNTFKVLLCLLRESLLCQNEAKFNSLCLTIQTIGASKNQSIFIKKLSKIVLKDL